MSDPVASEKAAELAKKERIELDSIKGTGSNGLIKIDDVRKAIADRKASESAKVGASSSAAESTPAPAAEPPAAPTSSVEEDAEIRAAEAAESDDPEEAAGIKAAEKNAARMPERAHSEGCPMIPTRVEIYEQQVPPKRTTDGQIQSPARVATMAHCLDCGQTREV